MYLYYFSEKKINKQGLAGIYSKKSLIIVKYDSRNAIHNSNIFYWKPY